MYLLNNIKTCKWILFRQVGYNFILNVFYGASWLIWEWIEEQVNWGMSVIIEKKNSHSILLSIFIDFNYYFLNKKWKNENEVNKNDNLVDSAC